MFFGRCTGWICLFLSILTASAEALAALGSGMYVSLATSDVLTIITGVSPRETDSLTGKIMMFPAWFSIGCVGLALIFLCRKKKIKSSFSMK